MQKKVSVTKLVILAEKLGNMENRENINEWNMVVINEDYIQVRDEASSSNDPPSPTSPTHNHNHQLPLTDPEDGTSSPLTAPLDWRVRVVNEWKKLLKMRLEAVRKRVVGVASKWAMCVGAFWSFRNVAGGAAVATVLVWVVYVGIRRRRRWVYLLREKDEKISQLLFQIAQLNEVLSSRRKVPVHQIN